MTDGFDAIREKLAATDFEEVGAHDKNDTPRNPSTVDEDSGGDGDKPEIDWEKVRECASLDQNDRDNARRLILWFGDEIAYVSGLGWLTWRDTHWQRDEGELRARLLAQSVVDKIKIEVQSIMPAESEQTVLDKAKEARRKPFDEQTADDRATIAQADRIAASLASRRGKRHSFAVSTGNASRTASMLAQAASLKAIEQDVLDADRNAFNLKNGTLRFARVEDEESDPDDPRYRAQIAFSPAHRRDDMITKCADVAYDDKATCPQFEAFLARVQPDPRMRQLLQVGTAYALLTGGNDEQKLFFHYGTGANGKSAFIEAIGRLAGSYRTVVSPETITGDNQRQGQQASPDIARLFNTRFVTVEELPKHAPLKEDLIKAVSGGSKMTARFLQKEIFEFEPIFTAMLTGNTKPSISGSDYGIWRRVLLIEWGVTIPEGERVQPSVLAARLDAERPGILNWLLAGLRLYLEQGLNPFIPPEVTAFTEDYRLERDNVSVFAGEMIEKQPGSSVTAGALYKAYTDWCELNGLRSANQRSFGDRLTEMGFHKRRGRLYEYLDITCRDVPTKASYYDPPPD